MVVDNVRMSARPFVVLFVLAAVVPARADGIALEAYTGERPADASRLVTPIFDELAARKFATGDTLAHTFDGSISRAPQTASGLPSDFGEQADRGFKLWVGGRFDEAIKQLVPLVEAAHANTGAFATAPALREPLRKAMIALGLSQMKTGDQAAMGVTFGELVRAFPDAQLSRATYGPEAFDAFEQVRRETNASGRGKLTVKVADEQAVVFIDEAYRAIGTTTAELVPGEYRVVAVVNKQPSRSHKVVVRAGGETTVVVDNGFDQAVRTSGWTGFSFPTEAVRDAHEAAYAIEFAKSTNATALAIVGIDQSKGHDVIVGSLISLQTGREIRRASVALDPDPSNDRLQALAHFLAGDPPAAGIEVQLGAKMSAAGVAAQHDEDHPSGRWGGWKWITSVAAVGALGAGTTLLVLDGRCKQMPQPGRPCNDVYANSPGQWIGLGVGAVLAGVSIYLFATQPSRPVRSAYVAPAPNGGVVGFTTSW